MFTAAFLLNIWVSGDDFGCFFAGFFYGVSAYGLLWALLTGKWISSGLGAFGEKLMGIISFLFGVISTELVKPPSGTECLTKE